MPYFSKGSIKWSCITLNNTTKSGLYEIIDSKLKVFPSNPPMEGISLVSGGKLQKSVRATTWFPAPTANKISVAEAPRLTILVGIIGFSSETTFSFAPKLKIGAKTTAKKIKVKISFCNVFIA